jgi:hypothetical protein
MGRKLVVSRELEAEGKQDRFVQRPLNYGNFRTSRQRRHVGPFQISRHDHYVIVCDGFCIHATVERRPASARASVNNRGGAITKSWNKSRGRSPQI